MPENPHDPNPNPNPPPHKRWRPSPSAGTPRADPKSRRSATPQDPQASGGAQARQNPAPKRAKGSKSFRDQLKTPADFTNKGLFKGGSARAGQGAAAGAGKHAAQNALQKGVDKFNAAKNPVQKVAKGFQRKEGESRARAFSRGMRKAGTEVVAAAGTYFGVPPHVTKAAIAGIMVMILIFTSIIGVTIVDSVISSLKPSRNENLPAVAQLPKGWDGAINDAAVETEVPYSIIAGLAKVQSDFGRAREVDGIDRDPKRNDDPQDLSQTLLIPAPEKQPKNVSVFPKVRPDIGGKEHPEVGLGPYLIQAGALKNAQADPQDVRQSTRWVAKEMARIRDDLSKAGWKVPNPDKATTEEADAFWSTVINRLPIINRFGSSCALPDPLPSVPETIQLIWHCQLSGQAANLQVVERVSGSGYTFMDYEAATDQLVDDALHASFAFSGWKTDSCDVNASGPQGIFPLPSSVVNRCDPVTNITEAAKLVVDGYKAAPASPEKLTDGPWSALYSGWATMPTVLGKKENRIGLIGPYNTWVPSDACIESTDAWLIEQLPQLPELSGDPGALTPEQRTRIDGILNSDASPRISSCSWGAGLPAAQWQPQWYRFLQQRASSLASSAEDEGETSSTPVSNGETPTLEDAPVVEDEQAHEHSGPSVDQVKQMQNLSSYTGAVAKPPVIGDDPLIPRFGTKLLAVNLPDVAQTGQLPQVSDLGQRVITASFPYGGTITKDPRTKLALANGAGAFAIPADAATISAASCAAAKAAGADKDRKRMCISQQVATAYLNAAAKSASLAPPGLNNASCRVTWEVVAAVWERESNHNATGMPLASNGDSTNKVIGIPLNGERGTAKISDTDDGTWDGDTTWDRAVGPSQFIPSTWKTLGADGNDDGVRNPFNVYDASLATINHLCYSARGSIDTDEKLAKGVFGYNHSQEYVNAVMGALGRYRSLNISSSAVLLTSGPGGNAPGPGGLSNPVPGALMTSPFGNRVHPLTGKVKLHAGQDYGVSTGTPLHSAADGVVLSVQDTSKSGGYGNYTCISHGGGLSTCYAHQSKMMVSAGQHVSRGQVVGLSGNTGWSTGPHLHFEVRLNGKPVDPKPYIG